jgi:pimeloyl-ACP methyl ester carboxylesterase
MYELIVLGPNKLLGTQIIGRLLAGTTHHVTWLLEDLDGYIAEELRRLIYKRSGLKEAAKPRFALIEWNAGIESNIRADEVWFLDGKRESPQFSGTEKQESPLTDAFRIIAASGAKTLNYVGSAYDLENGRQGSLPVLSEKEQQIGAFCAEHEIRNHSFLTSWLIGEDYVTSGSGDEVHCLLRALDDVIAEIQERTPEYFDFQALRVLAAKDAAVNLVSMNSAVELMLTTAAKNVNSDLRECMVSDEDISWQDFCEQLGEVYGVSILSVAVPEELNAIDRLLASRLSEVQSERCGKSLRHCRSGDSPTLAIERETQLEFLNSARQKQEQERTERDERISALPNKWEKKTIARNGDDLTYYIAGTQGEYILILNALGQPLDHWHRLVDVLMRRNRIILWVTRGLAAESQPLRLSDHVDDIDAILHEEQIGSCHLAGWCTGPQAAVEFYVRRPSAVMDMVFLSCAFKVADHPEMETAYGKNLEALCRVIVNNPQTTSYVRNSLAVPLASDINLNDNDTKNLADQVLLLANTKLRNFVLVPFQTDTSTFNYARQILDLATYPTLEYAGRVQVPVLVIGCECDQVAAAAKSGTVAPRFPISHHVEFPGATHYSFYDRPKLVADMMHSFFKESRAASTCEPVATAVGEWVPTAL